MALVYFGRTGTNKGRTSSPTEIGIATLVEELKAYAAHFSLEPPVVNADERPSQYSDYTLTVAHVDKVETCVRFPRAGYYLFQDLSPSECCRILDIEMPPL